MAAVRFFVHRSPAMKVFFVWAGNPKTNPLIGKFKFKLIVIQDDKCPVLAEKLVCDCDIMNYMI